MKKRCMLVFIAGGCLFGGGVRAEADIVRDGQTNAVIVIAEDPPRMVALAALELQYYLERISGARLPIMHEPLSEVPVNLGAAVNLFVGRSRYTDQFGITDEGLPYGAFRMVSGPDWLVLLGYDEDYSLPEAFQPELSRAERLALWDEMTAEVTDSKWQGPPIGTGRWWNPPNYNQLMTERYGADNQRIFNPRNLGGSRAYQGDGAGAGFWLYDRGGSLNAVYRYLMSLGVRWYMPGELGEVVPARATLPLPAIQKTVHPDYRLRSFNWSGFHTQPFDSIIWAKRIGMTSIYEVLGNYTWAHNLPVVYRREEMKEAYPEMFALRGGVRDTVHEGVGSACYSSEKLVQETVDYARFIFDRFDQPAIDLWPEDGYRHCGCKLCVDKTPSEAVWGFVDQVARRLYETHPDRLVTGGAYTPFKDAPETIERFSPNVGVMLSNVGRTRLDRPEFWPSFWAYVGDWYDKVSPGNLLRWENNFHNSRAPLQFPVIQSRAMAAELKALKGMSMGEFHNWQMRPTWHNPANSHLTLYTLAQYLWDADQDIEAFLDEYYTRFYGPASGEMKTALEYAQAHYERGRRAPAAVPGAVRVRLVELLQEARARGGDTIYGERIQLMMDELPSLEALRRLAYEEEHAPDPRADAPLLVGRAGLGPEEAATHRMKNLRTGEEPEIETTFQVWWADDALWFEVTCQEPDMGNLFATTLVYDGDSVVFVIETPAFSFYHIEVSPEGRVFSRAVHPPPDMGNWSAQAEVEEAVQGKDYWRVRVRLPVSGEDGFEMDPNHLIAGGKPTEEAPWYLNVGRSRVRGATETHVAFSPTGRGSYHVPDEFARFVVR